MKVKEKTYIKGQLAVMVMIENWEPADKFPNSLDRRGNIDDARVLGDQTMVAIALRCQAEAALFACAKIWKKKEKLLLMFCLLKI